MVSRLVLGCGSVGRTLVSTLADRPGTVLVCCGDEHRIETLRSDRVTARLADPTDPETLAAIARPIDVVAVAADDPAANRAAAELAREHYPDAFVLAYAGKEPSTETRLQIESAADRLVEGESIVARDLVERIGEASMRPRRLRRVLRSIDGPLAVVTHDNPDPDAIASALAIASGSGLSWVTTASGPSIERSTRRSRRGRMLASPMRSTRSRATIDSPSTSRSAADSIWSRVSVDGSLPAYARTKASG